MSKTSKALILSLVSKVLFQIPDVYPLSTHFNDLTYYRKEVNYEKTKNC